MSTNRLLVAVALSIFAFLAGQKWYYVQVDQSYRKGDDYLEQLQIDRIKRQEFESGLTRDKARNRGLICAGVVFLFMALLSSGAFGPQDYSNQKTSDDREAN